MAVGCTQNVGERLPLDRCCPHTAFSGVLTSTPVAIWVGINATDLMPLEASQRALIGRLDRERSRPLMEALDDCNCRHGRGSVVLASSGWVKARSWSTKFDMRSPCYTTRIDELPTVR
ncbi:DUF4113 domain-containing protein [Methylorubrum populi]|nr:DUF4113 domain-containing protein [Methylorubrum populi]